MATRFRDHSVPVCEDSRRDFSQARADFLIVDGCPLSRAIARLCQKAGFVKAVLSHETEQPLGMEALPETDAKNLTIWQPAYQEGLLPTSRLTSARADR